LNFFNKWIISVLVYIFIICTVVLLTVKEDILILFTPLMLVSVLGITTSLSINLTLHYKKSSKRFFKSYLFLTIGLATYTVAEIIWAVLDLIGQSPYPSPADPFYIIYFVFSIMFCVQMFWCRKNIITIYVKLAAVITSILFFGTYLIVTMENMNSDTFIIDTFFMALSSALIGTAVLVTITVWKAPKLKKVWIVLGIALTLNAIADLFYYVDTGAFLYSDISNIIWFGTTLMLFYGLYLHRFLYMHDWYER